MRLSATRFRFRRIVSSFSYRISDPIYRRHEASGKEDDKCKIGDKIHSPDQGRVVYNNHGDVVIVAVRHHLPNQITFRQGNADFYNRRKHRNNRKNLMFFLRETEIFLAVGKHRQENEEYGKRNIVNYRADVKNAAEEVIVSVKERKVLDRLREGGFKDRGIDEIYNDNGSYGKNADRARDDIITCQIIYDSGKHSRNCNEANERRDRGCGKHTDKRTEKVESER
mgnify:CR=1 FL=1